MQTLYKGIRISESGPQPVWKEAPQAGDGHHGQVVFNPGPSQKLYNHSPDGFQWGYAGSGPAQLALALLLDVTGDPQLSIRLHQIFKLHFVAAWGDKWQIWSDDIETWVEKNK